MKKLLYIGRNVFKIVLCDSSTLAMKTLWWDCEKDQIIIKGYWSLKKMFKEIGFDFLVILCISIHYYIKM